MISYYFSPESRPLFPELEQRFGNMLGEDVANVRSPLYRTSKHNVICDHLPYSTTWT